MLLWAISACSVSHAQSQSSSGPGPTLDRLAQQAVALLDETHGGLEGRYALLSRNLTPYFAVYVAPSNVAELDRFLGTLERVSSRIALQAYREAVSRARSAGVDQVQPGHVQAVFSELLPSRRNEFKELVFFPQLDTERQLPIEIVDLATFQDTGFSWEIVRLLAVDGIPSLEDALPITAEAAQRLAAGLTAHALVTLRIAGLLAKQELAETVQSRHLREAVKTIVERAESPAAIPGTVGGVAPADAPFREVAAASGIRFRHVSSTWIANWRRYGPLAPSFSGGGVGAGDLDGDDWPDLVYCGGQGCALFRNRRDGSFEDMTARSGLNVVGEARMPLLADFDNDGRLDVYITYARDTNRLFHNRGGGRFVDITIGSGLEQSGDISGPAIAFDYDGNGLLDIYVGNFGNYLAGETPNSPNASDNGMPNRLYRALGGLKFRETTPEASVADTGWSQALSHFDVDLDGDQDIYIANDFGYNDLLLNNGDGTFSSAGLDTGTDDNFHGMNVAFADLNRDGHAEIFITNIWFWNSIKQAIGETNSLLVSALAADGSVLYERSTHPVWEEVDSGWSWAALFFDYDNDADDDLYIVNGFTDYMTFGQYRPHPTLPGKLYPINNGRSPNLLLRNDDGMPAVLIENSGAELAGTNSRSLALLDYDRDADLDMAVSTFHSEARLFRNDAAPPKNRWLVVKLEGDPARGVNRDAIGSRVIARGDGGLYVWRMRTGGEGYLGVSTPELEFGLGSAATVDLEVIWPNLERQTFAGVSANQRLRIRQGQDRIEALDDGGTEQGR